MTSSQIDHARRGFRLAAVASSIGTVDSYHLDQYSHSHPGAFVQYRDDSTTQGSFGQLTRAETETSFGAVGAQLAMVSV